MEIGDKMSVRSEGPEMAEAKSRETLQAIAYQVGRLNSRSIFQSMKERLNGGDEMRTMANWPATPTDYALEIAKRDLGSPTGASNDPEAAVAAMTLILKALGLDLRVEWCHDPRDMIRAGQRLTGWHQGWSKRFKFLLDLLCRNRSDSINFEVPEMSQIATNCLMREMGYDGMTVTSFEAKPFAPHPEPISVLVPIYLKSRAMFAENPDFGSEVWGPFLGFDQVYRAGVLLYVVTDDGCYICGRPQYKTINRAVVAIESRSVMFPGSPDGSPNFSVGDELHCDKGPAIFWPNGPNYYFLNGVQIPEKVVMAPETLTVEEIDGEQNAEARRILLEKFGWGRYLEESGAKEISRDETGILLQKEIVDDEPLTMVKVRNSTPEPDGSVHEFLLRVPPSIQTAKEGVAWTFRMGEKEYEPGAQT